MADDPTRVPVPLTQSERDEIQGAMLKCGVRYMSEFLRMAALRMARAQA